MRRENKGIPWERVYWTESKEKSQARRKKKKGVPDLGEKRIFLGKNEKAVAQVSRENLPQKNPSGKGKPPRANKRPGGGKGVYTGDWPIMFPRKKKGGLGRKRQSGGESRRQPCPMKTPL